ncbi:hypothetical protein OKW40_004924 [Paraburkholderia sp. RAU6.4a]
MVIRLELGDQGTQFGLIVGQHFVVQVLSGPIESDGVMAAIADIDADEYVDWSHVVSFLASKALQVSVSTLRTASRYPALLKMEWVTAFSRHAS